MHSHMNKEYRFIFDEIMNASTTKKGSLYFVNGSGGTKRHFYEKQ